jgi:hypothetical protein
METLQKEMAVARFSTGKQQKEYEEKLDELKKGAADHAANARSYENRLKLTFGVAEKETLLNCKWIKRQLHNSSLIDYPNHCYCAVTDNSTCV